LRSYVHVSCVLFFSLFLKGAEDPALSLRINELLAANDGFLFPAALPVGAGESPFATPDLLEIHNPTGELVELSGLYLTNQRPGDDTPGVWWRLPPGVWLKPGGFLTVICDGNNVPGELRAPFRLARTGERIALVWRDKETVIDEVTFPCQLPDVSWARIPDGEGEFRPTASPTFCWKGDRGVCTCVGPDRDGDGAPDRSWCPEDGESPSANRADDVFPPDLDIVSYDPVTPRSEEAVEVTVSVACARTEVSWVRIEYRRGESQESAWIEMENTGPPSEEGDTYNVWKGTIPAQGPDVPVEFRVHAARGDAVDIEPDGRWIRYVSGRSVLPPLRITEVAASNRSGPTDSAGETEDWVELVNASDSPLSLEGYFLTDNRRRPLKWPFPSDAVLGPGERILVWCDGETDENGAEEFHAGFKLNADGDDVSVADALGIYQRVAFSDELPDISYGFAEPGGESAHFFPPSPGKVNPSGPVPAADGFSPEKIPSSGGTSVTASGENLDAVEQVLFGVVPPEDPLTFTPLEITGRNDTEIVFTVPACDPEEENVVLLSVGEVVLPWRFECTSQEPAGNFVRGETNDDGRVNLSDAVMILGVLFSAAPAPGCRDRLDGNDDGRLNLADAVYLLGYLFSGGPSPPPPFPGPGEDPTEDEIPCPAGS